MKDSRKITPDSFVFHIEVIVKYTRIEALTTNAMYIKKLSTLIIATPSIWNF
ncbi:hypothetical protein [Halobacillus litoralis]|uniref:hypothetical protein n=1 Tax=Halobacillus litoralis TaxID=45668 RepID=UPI002490A3DB|nr:hypothetical protein [Halobacillus litoralis]